jgi:hypothetical protein
MTMADALKIGIAGLGTVGASLAKILVERRDMLTTTCGRPIEIVAVTARSKGRDRGVDLSAAEWFDDPVALASEARIDVFVELMGGSGDPACAAVKAALSRGVHVVTANKALLAAHGVELAGIAEKNGAILNYEAAVAGGIPVIKALRESLTGNTISRVYGIMNGTCNYILTKMEKEGPSRLASRKPSVSAMPKPIPPSTSRATTRRTSCRSSRRSPSARRLRLTISISKASPTSPSTTSVPPPTSATASSCSASHRRRIRASNSACTRPWCRSTASSRKWTA